MKNFDKNAINIHHFMTDFGIVKESYSYEGGNIDEEVKELNRVEAEFGEEFRVSENDKGEAKIVKIAKTDHIVPLKALGSLELQA